MPVSKDVEIVFCVAGKRLRDIVSTCQKMCSCRFAWQAWHFVTFHVCEVQDCREAEVAVPIGKKAQKRVFFDVPEDVVMSFCVAGVALCDIPRV